MSEERDKSRECLEEDLYDWGVELTNAEVERDYAEEKIDEAEVNIEKINEKLAELEDEE